MAEKSRKVDSFSEIKKATIADWVVFKKYTLRHPLLSVAIVALFIGLVCLWFGVKGDESFFLVSRIL